MSDSLLVEALEDTRSLLEELEDDDDSAAATLRARVELVDRASAALELHPDNRELLARLGKLAIEIRDAALELRCRHRSVQQLILRMMD